MKVGQEFVDVHYFDNANVHLLDNFHLLVVV